MIISSKALHVLTYPYLQCNLKGLYDIKLYDQWCDLSNVYTAFAHAYFTSRAVFIFSNPPSENLTIRINTEIPVNEHFLYVYIILY